MELIVTVGRRKTSVARVFMKKGTGNIVVNDRPLATYFPIPYYQQAVVKPLTVTEMSNDMDIQVNVQGGGVSINRKKIEDIQLVIDSSMLLHGKYLLVQKGKKNYVIVEILP